MNPAKRCKRCRKRPVWGLPGELYCAHCREVRWREARGLCTAELWHGPGHQSTTYCERPANAHLIKRGRRLHSARYGSFDQLAEWFGRKRSTGYFDEPPSLD